MKKISLFVLGVCVLLSGCVCSTCQDGKCERYLALGCNQKAKEIKPVIVAAAAAPVVAKVARPVEDSQVRYYVVEQNNNCISESAVIKAPIVDKHVSVKPDDYSSFSRRVAVKDTSDNSVTFEYRDIRVDELMPLAAHYCSEHGDRTAILRKINLYHGYYRRVTFDCVSL